MKRDLASMERQRFDLTVIGGGIVGACIARDAVRRGLSVALVEQNDFASAASEAMSHTIHGGIRYLASGQLALVRQALAEKAVWLSTAPDFVCDQQFMLPLKGGMKSWQMRAGVALYQRLSGRRSTTLSAKHALEMEPCLEMPNLSGAAIYHDARIDDPDALIRALLQDAAAHGACIANHLNCIGLLLHNDKLAGLEVQDQLMRERFVINTAMAVNATGPWAQNLASQLLPGQQQARLTASKGIHVLTPALTRSYAIALSGKSEHAFILPWKGMSLIGTTDDVHSGDLNKCAATGEEIERLKQKVLRLLPAARACFDTILGTFGGVRALPGTADNTYHASREVVMCDHQSDGVQGFHSVFGGKWTTARLIAETYLDGIKEAFSKPLGICDTRKAEIVGMAQQEATPERLQEAADNEMAMTPGDFIRRLGRKSEGANLTDKSRVETWLASRNLRTDTMR
jgi:glycerol-3-phosphate dehydrogenase